MSETLNIDPERDLLLVIDVQNDFCPGGALAVPDGDAVVPVINTLSKRFRHAALTQDWHPLGHQSFASTHAGLAPFMSINLPYGEQTLWPDHCIQGTPGADFHPALSVSCTELIVRKGFRANVDSYSAFFENDRQTPTGMGGYLRERGISSLVIVGLATDYCVAYSALDAAALGFKVTVALPACRAINLNGSLESAFDQMKAAGVRIAGSID
jgi:nicotinamidase/pyrazinamidase